MKKFFYFKKIGKDLQAYQFKTFLIGIDKQKSTEEERKLLKRELGQMIEEKLGKQVDFANPDIVIKIDLKYQTINYQIKPLYFYGRYQKIKAGIPQTRWHKKIYHTSVQEEIGEVILKHTQGDKHVFHGCGREDIDVLMLGTGRPFVVEIKKPKIRDINLEEIRKKINQSKWVNVLELNFASKEKIKEIKLAKPDKIYLAEVQLKNSVSKEELSKTGKKLSNITIRQKTPQRVLRRRYDLERRKKIYYFKLKKYDKINPVFEIKTEAGTYIKELISGDNGRTKPSFSEVLKQKCVVKNLSVIDVIY